MSKEYRERTGKDMEPFTTEEMRIHCQRPGRKNEDGTPQYTTEQHHKRECDINLIIDKYDKHGLIKHVNEFEQQFGDMTGNDFKLMNDQIAHAKSMFGLLPWEIRERFQNNPQYLLSFMEKPENRAEAIKLGLITSTYPEELDGLGEHVTKKQKNDYIKETQKPKTETETPTT